MSVEISQWAWSVGWFVALLVLFSVAASCADAAILNDGFARISKAGDGSRNTDGTPTEMLLARSNMVAWGIGATLTLLSLGSLGCAWRRKQVTIVPLAKNSSRRRTAAFKPYSWRENCPAKQVAATNKEPL